MPAHIARTYLDANATEPLRPAARVALLEALDVVGNPSSVHEDGRAARRILEGARERVAARFGAAPANVVFTSGATEANALAISSLGKGRRVIVGATEHDAVLRAAPDAAVLPVEAQGLVDLAALEALLTQGPALVCVMLANNETGVIAPMQSVQALCAQYGALLHVDAVQAAGRMAIDVGACGAEDCAIGTLGADTVAVSAHKLGGPKGVGALLLKPNLNLDALIAGGGQERGRRGGTEALPAIAGFGAAVDAADPAQAERLRPLRDALEQAVIAAGAVVLGGAAPRLPNTSCIALPGMRADMQVITLDLAGLSVSAGSACSSGKVAKSRVVAAMGHDDLAGNSIRVSLPWNAIEADVAAFIVAYGAMAARRHGRAA